MVCFAFLHSNTTKNRSCTLNICISLWAGELNPTSSDQIELDMLDGRHKSAVPFVLPCTMRGVTAPPKVIGFPTQPRDANHELSCSKRIDLLIFCFPHFGHRSRNSTCYLHLLCESLGVLTPPQKVRKSIAKINKTQVFVALRCSGSMDHAATPSTTLWP